MYLFIHLSFFLLYLKQRWSGFVFKSCFSKNSLKIYSTPSSLSFLLNSLKNTTGLNFSQLIDIVVVDNINRKFRFTVVYSLLSLDYNLRLSVVISIPLRERIPCIVWLLT